MWQNFLSAVQAQAAMFRFTDIIDIIIVTYVIYKMLVFIRETRTVHLLKGIVMFLIVMQVSYACNLHTVYYILSNVFQLGFIAVLIVFQPELRRALEQLGKTSVGKGKWFNFDERSETAERGAIIAEVVRSCQQMSNSKIGALIVFEDEDKVNDIIETGIPLDAEISSELLVNIFIPKTPLHDGAVVIRGNKIAAAACFLPLSQDPTLSKELGTRHRAGLGISETSDAFVVIVSEETGNISVAHKGELKVNLTPDALTKRLTKVLCDDKKERNFKRGRKERAN